MRYRDLMVESESPDIRYVEHVRQMTFPGEVEVLLIGDGHTVEIRAIYTQQRGRGNGRAIMKTLIELADQLGVTLECEPLSAVEFGWAFDDGDEDFSDAIPQIKLEEWYKRLGFEFVRNRNPGPNEPEFSSTMIRRPRR